MPQHKIRVVRGCFMAFSAPLLLLRNEWIWCFSKQIKIISNNLLTLKGHYPDWSWSETTLWWGQQQDEALRRHFGKWTFLNNSCGASCSPGETWRGAELKGGFPPSCGARTPPETTRSLSDDGMCPAHVLHHTETQLIPQPSTEIFVWTHCRQLSPLGWKVVRAQQQPPRGEEETKVKKDKKQQQGKAQRNIKRLLPGVCVSWRADKSPHYMLKVISLEKDTGISSGFKQGAACLSSKKSRKILQVSQWASSNLKVNANSLPSEGNYYPTAHFRNTQSQKKTRLGARIFFWLFCKYHSPLVRRALDCIFFFFFFTFFFFFSLLSLLTEMSFFEAEVLHVINKKQFWHCRLNPFQITLPYAEIREGTHSWDAWSSWWHKYVVLLGIQMTIQPQHWLTVRGGLLGLFFSPQTTASKIKEKLAVNSKERRY